MKRLALIFLLFLIYNAATFAQTKLNQTINFKTTPTLIFEKKHTITATATSGLAVSFTSTTPDICTINDKTISPIATGSCIIDANQTGNNLYNPASASLTLTVAKANQHINLGIAPKLLASETGNLSANASSGLPVSFASNSMDICTVSENNVSALSSGVCEITASQAGNSDINPAKPVNQSFIILKNHQSISFGTLPAITVGNSDAVTATASSGLAVNLASLTPKICSISANVVNGLSTGSCKIKASQSGNNAFRAAPTVTGLIPVIALNPVTISGKILDNNGKSISGIDATISVLNTTTTSKANGAYSLTVTPENNQLSLTTSANGYAPQISNISLKPSVTNYALSIKLSPLTSISIDSNGGIFPIKTPTGQTLTLSVPANAINTSGQLRFTAFDANNGPGSLNVSQDEALQSAGMVYFDIVDSNGNPIPINSGANISITTPAFKAANIPGAKTFKGYQLNAQNGQWGNEQTITPANASHIQTNAQATAMLTASTNIQASDIGYWNVDRAYKTACVKGKIQTPKGNCTGGRVQAAGVDNLSSYDNTSADGSFCVTGAQTRSSTLLVGGFSKTVTMPINAGNCSFPQTCTDIGIIKIPVSDCTDKVTAPITVSGTLTGSFSGGCPGASVSGTFTIDINFGAVTGSFSGVDSFMNTSVNISAPITGQVTTSGNLNASGGNSNGEWTGEISQNGTTLSGNGHWTAEPPNAGCLFSGSWNGTGTASQ